MGWNSRTPSRGRSSLGWDKVPRTYYFDLVAGDNNNPGTIDEPKQTFHDSGMAAAHAVLPGTTIKFLRGDIIEGPDGLTVDSNGARGLMITVDCYGDTGDNKPIFRGSELVADTWIQEGSTEVWSIPEPVTDSAVVCVDMVYDKTADEAHDALYGQPTMERDPSWTGYALNKTTGSFAAMPRKTFRNSGGRLYVRLEDGSDPNGHDIYTPHQNQVSGIFRGLVRAGNARGAYVSINNILVEGAQGKGISLSQPYSEINDCAVFGSGRDNVLTNGFKPTAEMAHACTVRRTKGYYGETWGGGQGQPMTNGASYLHMEDCWFENGIMAGIDMLDYNASDTLVEYCTLLRCVTKNNGMWQSEPSFDANFYFDGPRYVVAYDCHVIGGGRGTGSANNARAGMHIGSEHHLARQCHSIEMINCTGVGTRFQAFNIANVGASTGSVNVYGVKAINCTYVAQKDGNFAQIYGFSSAYRDRISVEIKNCILYGTTNTVQQNMSNATVPFPMWLDQDYNLIWRTAGGHVYNLNGTDVSFANWQLLSGLDANSATGNPLLLTDVAGPNDATNHYEFALKRNAIDGGGSDSPAIDIGIPLLTVWRRPMWIDTSINPNSREVPVNIEGTTKSNGEPLTTNDVGYHGRLAA